jgi:beta-glucanase (GH16 family)
MALRLLKRGRFVAVAAVAGLALSGCIGAVQQPAAPVPPPVAHQAAVPPAGTHLVFSDDFAGTSLDTTKWDTCYPWADTGSGCTNFGNNELEWYLPSQDQVSGGALHLVASQTPTEGTTRAGAPQSYPWRSGIVTTFNSLEFTYGYLQVTARIPAGDGFWPTLWLLPQSEGWPPEIDFEESHDGDTHSTSETFHPATGPQDQLVYTSPSDLSAGWHTYAVDWEPGAITWYVDGNAVYTHTGSDVPSQPMYFLANLAVSGGEDPPTASTPPSASFDIQSVQIYQH